MPLPLIGASSSFLSTPFFPSFSVSPSIQLGVSSVCCMIPLTDSAPAPSAVTSVVTPPSVSGQETFDDAGTGAVVTGHEETVRVKTARPDRIPGPPLAKEKKRENLLDRKDSDKQDGDRKKTVPCTFNNWLQAFCFFASVMDEKHAELCSSLFCHLEIILEAYKNFPGLSCFFLC